MYYGDEFVIEMKKIVGNLVHFLNVLVILFIASL